VLDNGAFRAVLPFVLHWACKESVGQTLYIFSALQRGYLDAVLVASVLTNCRSFLAHPEATLVHIDQQEHMNPQIRNYLRFAVTNRKMWPAVEGACASGESLNSRHVLLLDKQVDRS
jgi:hypothetical protein